MPHLQDNNLCAAVGNEGVQRSEHLSLGRERSSVAAERRRLD